MKLTQALLVAAGLAAGVAADFQIYFEDLITEDADGNSVETPTIRMFDAEPDCDDVVNNYASLSLVGDASSQGYARCDGCDPDGDPNDWTINALEMNAQGDWGHFTIYKDSGFMLTPADGGPLQGSCTRDLGTDDYSCSDDALGLSNGVRLFFCTSPKTGYHAQ